MNVYSVYTHTLLNHFALHRELIQHYKSIIFQLKIFEKKTKKQANLEQSSSKPGTKFKMNLEHFFSARINKHINRQSNSKPTLKGVCHRSQLKSTKRAPNCQGQNNLSK